MTGGRAGGAGDASGGAALVAVALFALWSARDLPVGSIGRPGPGMFPIVLASLLGLLGALIVRRGLRARSGAASSGFFDDEGGRRRVLILGVALLAFVLAVEHIGFVAAAAALIFIVVVPVGGRGWREGLALATAASLGAWLAFARLLRVNLPAGPLGF